MGVYEFSADQFPLDFPVGEAVNLEGIDTIVLSYDVYNREECAKCVKRLRERIGEKQ